MVVHHDSSNHSSFTSAGSGNTRPGSCYLSSRSPGRASLPLNPSDSDACRGSRSCSGRKSACGSISRITESPRE